MRTLVLTSALLAVLAGCAHPGGEGPALPTGYPGAGPPPSGNQPAQSPIRAPECTTDADCGSGLSGRPGWNSRCVNAHCQ